jgi:hypothetical protein
MTTVTATRTRRTYTEAERAEMKAQRAALVEQVKTFEPEGAREEDAYDRLTQRYSHRNSLLIIMQCPATRGDVKAMSAWNAEGRKVRKGQHGLLILAPAGDRKADVEIEDDTAKDEAPRRLRFVWVRVFDRSQTEPLPADWGKGRKVDSDALQAHADECEAETPAPAARPVEPSRTAALDDFLN